MSFVSRERAQHERLREFAKWLIEMDDPNNTVALERRRSVTLAAIIADAREALGEPKRGPHSACPECGKVVPL